LQSPARVSPAQDVAEPRRLEARAELRALMRDADRRTQEDWLLRHGSAEDVERYRARLEAEDALDEQLDRVEAERLPPAPGFERFGPETRRLLERSHVELRWVERRQERDLRLHELERAVTGSEARDPGSGFGASPAAP
jgi:hypothetical protein